MEQKVTTAVIIRPVYVGLEESRVDLWPRTLRLSVTNSLYYQCAVWNMCGGWDFGINEIVHTRDREERNFFEEQTKFSVKDPLTAGTTIRTWTIMPTGISAYVGLNNAAPWPLPPRPRPVALGSPAPASTTTSVTFCFVRTHSDLVFLNVELWTPLYVFRCRLRRGREWVLISLYN